METHFREPIQDLFAPIYPAELEGEPMLID